MKVEAIIFDCFGVLYQGSLDHLMELCPKDRRRELKDISHSFDYGFVDSREFIDQVAEILATTADAVTEIMQRAHVKNVLLIDYIHHLRKNYKVAMLSNIGRGTMSSLFSSEELDDLFDVVVLSGDIGMAKPEVRIYEHTSMLLGVSEDRCVMIDDMLPNLSGAEAAGMSAVLYRDVADLRKELSERFGVQ